MKKAIVMILSASLIFSLAECSQSDFSSGSGRNSSQNSQDPNSQNQSDQDSDAASESEPEETLAASAPEQTDTSRQITVTSASGSTVFELNESPAAEALYNQLPLTIEVEDYSTNEKIFYPPEDLDTSDTPLADAGAGTLAYYEPWGDVAMFYDDFRAAGGLYELGRAVSGEELIERMSGTVEITAGTQDGQEAESGSGTE